MLFATPVVKKDTWQKSVEAKSRTQKNHKLYSNTQESLIKPTIWTRGRMMMSRHEAIMLQKLSIMLLSSAQKITYYAFENCPLFPKLCHHNWLIMPVYCCIRPFSLMFRLQIVLNSLAGYCIREFHFNMTALLE